MCEITKRGWKHQALL